MDENEVNKILIESITKTSTAKLREIHTRQGNTNGDLPLFNIRVWRQEYLDPKEHDITDMQFKGTRNSIENAMVLYKRFHKGKHTPYTLAKYLITKITRANAVEVIDTAGHGVVLYADWP